MLNICHVCLRNLVSHHPISEELGIFYEDLCNFKHDKDYKFCLICINNLQMCYGLKIKCMLAAEQLQSLKQNLIDIEYAKPLPSETTTVEVCTPTTHTKDKKAKRKTDSAKKKTTPKDKDKTTKKRVKENSESNVPTSDIKLEIVEHDYAKKSTKLEEVIEDNDIKDEIIVENDIKTEMIVENDTKTEMIVKNDTKKEMVVENDTTEGSDDDYCDDDQDSDWQDESKEEQTLPRKGTVFSSLAKIDIAKTLCKNAKFLEDLRSKFRSKFEVHGKVIDKKGIVVDPNVVLNHLDKLCDRNLTSLQHLAVEPGAFKPGQIERLSIIQDRFKYDKVFHIKYLTDEKQMIEEFEKRKTFPDYLSGKHKCDKCYIGFRNALSLANHINHSHNESFPFACSICECRFKMLHNLKRHILCYHSNVYKCKFCPDYTVHYKGSMTRHFLKHKGLVNTCKICKKEFTCVSSFYMHMNKAHRSSSDHICALCARTFHSAVGFNSHFKRMHVGQEFKVGPENVKCDTCDILFLNNQVYRKHKQLTHGVNYRTKDSGKCNKDKERAISTKEYLCDLCDKTGNYAQWLFRHYKKDHPDTPYPGMVPAEQRKHLCEECGKNFKSATELNQHKNLHTGQKPFACSKCPARFYRKMNLNMHMERHEPPKHQCQYCGKKFGSKPNLGLHTRIHKGDRRYKCDICDKRFLIKRNLDEHVQGVHCNIKRQKKKPAGPKIRIFEKYPMDQTQNVQD